MSFEPTPRPALVAAFDDVGDGAALTALHDRLVDSAAREDVLDVSFTTVDSPFGALLLAATPVGLVRVAFALEDHAAVTETLARTVGPRMLHAPRRLDDAARQLDEYFAGRRRQFDFPLDLQLAHGFRHTVLDHLLEIAYGATETYAMVARAAGSPGAVRAVGSACRTNPMPVVVPCHRVVRSDGTIGQYLGGPETKRALLALEAGQSVDGDW